MFHPFWHTREFQVDYSFPASALKQGPQVSSLTHLHFGDPLSRRRPWDETWVQVLR